MEPLGEIALPRDLIGVTSCKDLDVIYSKREKRTGVLAQCTWCGLAELFTSADRELFKIRNHFSKCNAVKLTATKDCGKLKDLQCADCNTKTSSNVPTWKIK